MCILGNSIDGQQGADLKKGADELSHHSKIFPEHHEDFERGDPDASVMCRDLAAEPF